MSYRSHSTLAVAVSLLSLFPAIGRSQVECWAPGMSSSVTLTQADGSRGISLGKPYRYDVFGVAGTIELGSSARNATVKNGLFKQNLLLGATGGTVESTASVTLQTGLLKFYPEKLSVKGTAPGALVGPIQQYGQNWTLCDPKNPAEVNLAFHLAGSSGLTGLLPGLLEPAYCNLNPKGHFYVLGEYHATPPVMTGKLEISTDLVLVECPVSLTYAIERNETPVYRPPFLGLDLGDVNLTVLGTPPANNDSHSSGGLQATVKINPSQVSVVINLQANDGNGWSKTTTAP